MIDSCVQIKETVQVCLLDPLGNGNRGFRHLHYLRDWSGAFIPGYFPFPPLDLLYAATYLKKYGYGVKIIEASIEHLSHKKLVEILKKDIPNFVVIPSAYFSTEDDKYLSRLIRQSLPSIKIIFCGPLATYNPALFLSDNSADFVAVGELESPLLNIVRGDYSENVAYYDQGKINTGRRKLLDLSQLPIPDRSLINTSSYKYAIVNRRNPVTTMTMSRGCPHGKCKFCSAWLYTMGELRYRDIDSVCAEIDEIVHKYNIGEIFFRDQAFTANRDYIVKVCEYIISRGLGISWRATTRVDLVDRQLLALMKQAGCYQISFGFESCSQKSLDMNNKGISVAQSRQAAKWAKDDGMEIVGMFMFGMLGDTEDSLKEQLKFVLELDLDYVQFNESYLCPGTPVYDEFIQDKDLFLSRRLVKKHVIAAYLRFYLRPAYIRKQLKKIRSLNDIRFLIKAGLDELLFHL